MKKLYAIATMAFMLCLAGVVMPGASFAQQCVDNEDGTVTDMLNGLMWQKATIERITWSHAMSIVPNLDLGGYSDWRMPSMDELKTLSSSSCLSMMDAGMFNHSWHWSATTDPYNNAWAKLVLLRTGEEEGFYKTSNSSARGVRTAR